MCNYIKDNGEQCGMNEDPFCRHHDDTEQAELHALGREMFDGGDMPSGGQFAQLISKAVDIHSAASDSAQSGSEFGDMETHCDECGAALRRRERLREHPHSPRRIVFEAYIECDCAEHTLGTKGVRRAELPGGWE